MLKKILIITALAILALYFLANGMIPEKDFTMNDKGLVVYPENRGKVNLERTVLEENATYTIEKVNFQSKDLRIYGLLFLPKESKDIGIVTLPGANGGKGNHRLLGTKLASRGITVLALDQRTIGETGGSLNSPQEDFELFNQGKEPSQYLMFYDALRAKDVLSSLKIKNILLMGESMGGRFAINAAAIDKNIKGVIVFSVAGYEESGIGASFIHSFNPNAYISEIAPRKVVMFHSERDSVIPIAEARKTFDLSKEPREFLLLPEQCDHGYCDEAFETFYEKIMEIAKE